MGGVDNFTEATGIKARRRSLQEITASDLCLNAAEKLIAELGWEKSEIEVLVFVSQTPDYILPATSCVLQQRLGLSKSVILSTFLLDVPAGYMPSAYSRHCSKTAH